MVLSEEIKKEIEEMRSHFASGEALCIPLLHSIQKSEGWISPEAMRTAASYLNISLKRVREVATFYTMFNKKPVGKVHLQLCTNISCWLKGSDHLLHCLEKKLQIKCGETTADGVFTLSEVECLASCGTAPALQANEEYHENLSEEKLLALLKEMKEMALKGEQVGICDLTKNPKGEF